jgi:hypothetical protein
VGQLVKFLSLFVVEGDRFESVAQFIDQFSGKSGEIVDEVEWIFDLVRDARSELTKRSKLLGLDQTILSGAQFIERSRKLFGARLIGNFSNFTGIGP